MPERSRMWNVSRGTMHNICILFRFIIPRLFHPANKHQRLLAFQEDAATGLPASSSATSFTMGCTSAIARTGTSFIKMDTAAPVSSPFYKPMPCTTPR